MWTNLPQFQCAHEVCQEFTDNTIVMDELCFDILEEVRNAPMSHFVVAVSTQTMHLPESGLVDSGNQTIYAIQLQKKDQNIVFRVSNKNLPLIHCTHEHNGLSISLQVFISTPPFKQCSPIHQFLNWGVKFNCFSLMLQMYMAT